MTENNRFYSPTKGEMDLGKVIEEIRYFIREDPQRKYKIVIGTDSEGNGRVDFVTALVMHRKGKGGRYFWKREFREKVHNLRQKIYQEVDFSMELAQNVLEKLREQREEGDSLGRNLEIHIDVGENGETRDMIKEVVGMVRGNGFNVRTKPEAYGASSVADKHV